MTDFYTSYLNDNIKICPQCGDISSVFFEIDGTTQIENPTQCGKCNVELYDTGKNLLQWRELYSTHIGKPTCDNDVCNWIGELYAQEHPEFREALNLELKRQEEWDKKVHEEFVNSPKCPKCLSTSITQEKRGFSFGKAIVATSLTGFLDVGAAAGAIGRNKMVNVCRVCGHRWK